MIQTIFENSIDTDILGLRERIKLLESHIAQIANTLSTHNKCFKELTQIVRNKQDKPIEENRYFNFNE